MEFILMHSTRVSLARDIALLLITIIYIND